MPAAATEPPLIIIVVSRRSMLVAVRIAELLVEKATLAPQVVLASGAVVTAVLVLQRPADWGVKARRIPWDWMSAKKLGEGREKAKRNLFVLRPYRTRHRRPQA